MPLDLLAYCLLTSGHHLIKQYDYHKIEARNYHSSAIVDRYSNSISTCNKLLQKPVLVKIAHILDIKVNVLTRELRSGESIMEIAEEYDATKSEIKEIKKF